MILAATEQGAGAPVCLLHGLFGQSRNLGVVARALAASFRVISLDLRNHGKSPHAPGMEYRSLAQDVLETLASLDALPACLIGHSMGGKTAMAAALLQPAAVQRLVVADIAPVSYAHGNQRITAALQAVKLQDGLTRAQLVQALAPSVATESVRQFLAQNFEPRPAPHWSIGLDEIAAGIPEIEAWPDFGVAHYNGPCLFLAGGQSDYITAASEPAMARLFPRYSLQTIAQAGHWLHADQPAAFIAAVQDFLRG